VAVTIVFSALIGCTLQILRYKKQAPGWLAGPERFHKDLKMDNSVVGSSRKGFFHLKSAIGSLQIKRQIRVVLLAIAALCPAGETSTERFPVTYERLMAETGYSRSHVMALIKEAAESTPYLHVTKQPYRREDGSKWNRANIYKLVLPDVVPSTKKNDARAQKRVSVASSAPAAPIEPTPTFEAQEEPIVEDFDESEVDPMDPPAGYYERLQAEYLAQEESTIPTIEEPQNEIVADLSEPESVAVTVTVTEAPIAREVAPQSPDKFTEEEQIVGHEVAQYAHAKLAPLVEDAATRKRAMKGRDAITMAMFMIGRFAVSAMDTHAIGINDIFYAVDEWIVRSVLSLDPRFVGAGPSQHALRLKTFFDGKGKAIDNGRRKKLGLDRC
jgi:hypothetical protein